MEERTTEPKDDVVVQKSKSLVAFANRRFICLPSIALAARTRTAWRVRDERRLEQDWCADRSEERGWKVDPAKVVKG